jgi:hypothetical protein
MSNVVAFMVGVVAAAGVANAGLMIPLSQDRFVHTELQEPDNNIDIEEHITAPDFSRFNAEANMGGIARQDSTITGFGIFGSYYGEASSSSNGVSLAESKSTVVFHVPNATPFAATGAGYSAEWSLAYVRLRRQNAEQIFEMGFWEHGGGPYNFSGTLEPGTYVLTADARATSAALTFWTYTSMQFDFHLIPAPGVGAVLMAGMFVFALRRRP